MRGNEPLMYGRTELHGSEIKPHVGRKQRLRRGRNSHHCQASLVNKACPYVCGDSSVSSATHAQGR